MDNKAKSNIEIIIKKFPLQLKAGVEYENDYGIKGNFQKTIICGMGGSALAGDLVRSFFNEKMENIDTIVHRNYGLPKKTNNALIIVSSYSGNTEEALSSYKKAISAGLPVAILTSGGKLKELGKKNSAPIMEIPEKNIPPRLSVGYQFGLLINLFGSIGLSKNYKDELIEASESLKEIDNENKGKELSEKIFGKIPLIYASTKWTEIAHNWKIQFNENAKTPAFFNRFPELNHNEIESFGKNASAFSIILLRDNQDDLRIRRRMNLTLEILKEREIDVHEIAMQGNDYLTKMFSMIILGDWTSYYLGIKNKINPETVETIEEFKKKLSS